MWAHRWAPIPHILEPTYEHAIIKVNIKLHYFVILCDFCAKGILLLNPIDLGVLCAKMLMFKLFKTQSLNLGSCFQ